MSNENKGKLLYLWDSTMAQLTKYTPLVIIVACIAVSYYSIVWSIILLIIALPLWKAWQFRDGISLAVKSTEAAIWGKPLDKDIWEKGEMKNNKVRIVWKKKK